MPTISIQPGPLPDVFIPASLEPLPFSRPFALCRVAAGFPSPAQEYLDDSLDLNAYLVRNKTATFFFRSTGWSMRDENINDGDILVVDRSIAPKHDHIVVATVDGDFTVKKLYRRAGVIELRPANPAFKPICFGEGEEMLVWGVVTSVIHTFNT
jgi:DNA polymerase V